MRTLLNRRAIGGPSDDLDSRGETYVTRQEAYLAQRFANLVEPNRGHAAGILFLF